jgi:hypothetical protein
VKAAKLRRIVAEEMERVIVEGTLERPRYAGTFNTLEIRFAPGSEPAALSIPYQPWDNRTEISVPLKVVQHDV